MVTRLSAPVTPRTGLGERSVALALAPVGLEAFLAEHWSRRPLIVPRAERGRFDEVLSREEVERLVCAAALRVPAFRMVRDGAQVPVREYTEDIPWSPGVLGQTARAGEVARQFAAGATLVLQALHVHHLPAARLCRGLEMALGCPVQANAYYTPARAQGFKAHHDTHDVLVLQVHGVKRWRVYEPVHANPLKDQKFTPGMRERVGLPVEDFELRAGDTLYLPRGWPHEAFTSDGESVHVTVGLHPPTRIDALRGALANCADDPEFRETLDGAGEVPMALLDRLAERLDPETVAQRTRRRFVAGRRPILPDQLSQLTSLERLAADTEVERRDTVIAELEDGATLLFEGREVAFPPQAAAAVRFVFEADGPFTPADLPGLDQPGALVLVKRLVREGFLRVCRPG